MHGSQSERGIVGFSVLKRFNTDTLLEIVTPRKTKFVAVCDTGGTARRLRTIPTLIPSFSIDDPAR
jgi:hypothetical protein